MKKRLALCTSFLLAAGCGPDNSIPPDRQEPLEQATAARQEPAAVIPQPEPASSVPQETSRITLRPTQEISGQFEPPQTGALVKVGIKIGNFRNTADGELTLEICHERLCTHATRPLADSIDNKQLEFTFEPALHVGPGEQVTWTLTRSAGNSPVVVWTYPRRNGRSGVKLPDGGSEDRMPRITLEFVDPKALQ